MYDEQYDEQYKQDYEEAIKQGLPEWWEDTEASDLKLVLLYRHNREKNRKIQEVGEMMSMYEYMIDKMEHIKKETEEEDVSFLRLSENKKEIERVIFLAEHIKEMLENRGVSK